MEATKKPIHAKPSLYAFYFEAIKEIGMRYGYNIVLHGSMNRDLDLIAIPWAEKIKPWRKMCDLIAELIGGDVLEDSIKETHHGRIWCVININRDIQSQYQGRGRYKFIPYQDPQFYIDISIIPGK